MSSAPRMPTTSFSKGRWDVWRPHCGQHPTDAIANWEAKARARVDWQETSRRTPSNRAIHILIPHLSCVKSQPLSDDHGHTLIFACNDQIQADCITRQQTQRWRTMNPQYEWVESWPCGGWNAQGQFVVSITICYKLNYYPIQDCWGEGPNKQAAKADAAQKLLGSGHCMIYLPN